MDNEKDECELFINGRVIIEHNEKKLDLMQEINKIKCRINMLEFTHKHKNKNNKYLLEFEEE